MAIDPRVLLKKNLPGPLFRAIRYFLWPHEREGNYFRADLTALLAHGRSAPRVHELLWCHRPDLQKATRFLEWHGALPEGVQMFKEGHPDWREGFIVPGDWDRWVTPLSEVPVIDRTIRRFRDGLSWEEVGEVAYIRDCIALTGRPKDGCLTPQDIAHRLERLDRLHAFITAGGLLVPQKDVRRRSFREHGGISVGIGHDGALVWIGGGAHRLGIAQATGLEHLPVCVARVHPDAIRSGAYGQLKAQSARIGQKLRTQRENPPWRLEPE